MPQYLQYDLSSHHSIQLNAMLYCCCSNLRGTLSPFYAHYQAKINATKRWRLTRIRDFIFHVLRVSDLTIAILESLSDHLQTEFSACASAVCCSYHIHHLYNPAVSRRFIYPRFQTTTCSIFYTSLHLHTTNTSFICNLFPNIHNICLQMNNWKKKMETK